MRRRWSEAARAGFRKLSARRRPGGRAERAARDRCPGRWGSWAGRGNAGTCGAVRRYARAVVPYGSQPRARPVEPRLWPRGMSSPIGGVGTMVPWALGERSSAPPLSPPARPSPQCDAVRDKRRRGRCWRGAACKQLPAREAATRCGTRTERNPLNIPRPNRARAGGLSWMIPPPSTRSGHNMEPWATSACTSSSVTTARHPLHPPLRLPNAPCQVGSVISGSNRGPP